MNENENKELMADIAMSVNIISNDLKKIVTIYSPEILLNLLMMTKGSPMFKMILFEIISAGKIEAIDDYVNNIKD